MYGNGTVKILYDHQMFELQRFGGITRYFIELMSRLSGNFEFSNSIVFNDNFYLRNADSTFSKGFKIPFFRGAGRLSTIVNRLKSELDIYKGSYDVFHPTYYHPYFLKRLHKPYVVTVHDMIHERFRDAYSPSDPTCEYKERVIRNADKIIAISKNTKKDIVDFYGIDEHKIQVVYHGYGNSSGISKIADLPRRYILFVGQRNRYKNFNRLLHAFAIVRKKVSDLQLICTGSDFTLQERILINSLKMNDAIRSMFVTDSQLNYLYQKAVCFVYPSLYEGFGIPILEAFSEKCPVVLSDASCFPEIALDGGIYFNPHQIDSIVDALFKIITDDNLRRKKIARGSEILNNYSWDKMAMETMSIYRELV